MTKNTRAHYRVILSLLFCIAGIAASEQSAVSFASKQHSNSVGALIASIINGYIGKDHERIVYCTKQKNFFLVEDESHALGKGHLQLAPNIQSPYYSQGNRIAIEYCKEVPVPDAHRVVVRAIYEVGTAKDLTKLSNGSKLTINPSTGDTVYDMQWAGHAKVDFSNPGKADRDARIREYRKEFGSECLPPHLTGENGDAQWYWPYLITCQNEKLKIFKTDTGTVSAFEVRRRVNKFFQRYFQKQQKTVSQSSPESMYCPELHCWYKAPCLQHKKG